ncbi:hypothetical protein BJX99DRAFT_257549 [Aspergillus californicus]
MALSQTALVMVFLHQVNRSYRWSSLLAGKWLREEPGRYWKGMTQVLGRRAYHSVKWKQKLFLLLNILSLALLVTAKTGINFMGSTLSDLIWLLLSLVWGTMRLFFHRSSGDQCDSREGNMSEENIWGFEQWVPVLLLLMPLLNAVESYLDSKRTSQSSGQMRLSLPIALLTTSQIDSYTKKTILHFQRSLQQHRTRYYFQTTTAI